MTDRDPSPAPSDPSPPHGLGAASDPELITLVRAGDTAAYEQLFLRHHDVALRYARRIADSERAEDLAAEAFTKILDLLQRGKGPDVAFRAYLLTTVRTSHLNSIRAGSREELVPDHEPISRMLPVLEDSDERFDRGAIYRAFSHLPERWQAALWLTTVEGLPNDEVSLHLGIKANAVASLTFRARAGLRQAYLAEHLLDTSDPECRRVVEQLPSHLRGSLTPRRRKQVDDHLSTCARCSLAALELHEVDGRLGALLAPLALAGFGVGGAALAVPAKASLAGMAVGSLKTTKAAILVSVAALGVAVGAQALHRDAAVPEGAVVTHESAYVMPMPTRTLRVVPRRDRVVVPPLKPAPSLLVSAPVHHRHPSARPVRPSAPPSIGPVVGSPTGPATTAFRTIAVGPLQSESHTQDLDRWEHVTVPVSNPTPGTTLLVTTSRTLQVLPAATSGTGWVCGSPSLDLLSGDVMSTSQFSCEYVGPGGQPLAFDLQVAGGAVVTAALTPSADAHDDSADDNVASLHLRD